VTAPKPLTPELKAEVAKIEDDGLRSVIERAASANLAWQEFVGDPKPKIRRDKR